MITEPTLTRSSGGQGLMLTGAVAKALNVSPDYVRMLERGGRIHAFKTTGGVRLFEPAEVARAIRERASQSETRGRR